MVFKSDDGSNIVVREDEYEGYGVFGGIDYYVALFEMNKNKLFDNRASLDFNVAREIGIDIAFEEIPVNGKIEYPQLFTVEPTIDEIDNINWCMPCPDDPNQGWVVDDDIDYEY